MCFERGYLEQLKTTIFQSKNLILGKPTKYPKTPFLAGCFFVFLSLAGCVLNVTATRRWQKQCDQLTNDEPPHNSYMDKYEPLHNPNMDKNKPPHNPYKYG